MRAFSDDPGVKGQFNVVAAVDAFTSTDPAENRAMIQGCLDALKPGGFFICVLPPHKHGRDPLCPGSLVEEVLNAGGVEDVHALRIPLTDGLSQRDLSGHWTARKVDYITARKPG